MKQWIFLVLVVATLSGCTDDAGDAEPTDPSEPGQEPGEEPEGEAPGEPGEAGTGNATPNTPPEVTLGLSLTKGPAPLNVTIGINATDVDGDTLTWSIDLDGDGEADADGDEVPATLYHTYDVGNHTITLRLTDGLDAVTKTATVNATEVVETGIVYEGIVESDCQTQCGAVCAVFCYAAAGAMGCDSFRDGTPGGDCIWFELPPEHAGKSFTIASTGGDPDAEFRASCDPTETDPEAQVETVVFGEHTSTASGAEAGTVPDDLPCVVLWEWETSTPSTITMTII